jgi:hypothetical protein
MHVKRLHTRFTCVVRFMEPPANWSPLLASVPRGYDLAGLSCMITPMLAASLQSISYDSPLDIQLLNLAASTCT